VTLVSSVAVIVVGFVVLARAADQFVVGAARVAVMARVSPVVVGAVVIGFGTSSPELLVSGVAAWEGQRDIAVGNLIGSNVANVALVVGLAALITPLAVTAAALRREAAISTMAIATFALLVQGSLTRSEGVIMLLGLFAALATMVRGGRIGARDAVPSAVAHRPRPEAFRVALALGLILVSAHAIVSAAGSLAESLRIAQGFIGFTLVAVGTTLPELVTAVQASRRNEGGLIVGNVLGSNVFNSLAVGGAIALVGPGPVDDPSLTGLGAGAMVAIAGVGWLLMFTSRTVTRTEGALLLVGYAGLLPILARA
jgi:cation:H+ antiporter